MKKQMIFKGAATALITPFCGGEVDYGSLGALIDSQIKSGIDALVIGGTTAEAATLDDSERYKIFEFAKERVNGKTKLIFGTGTNDTRTAIKHAKTAERCKCDGLLVVTPYYNKGTHRGVVRHYLKIAESVDLPIIVYNVPSRTGVDLTLTQLDELSLHDNVVGIKEAGDSLDKMAHLSLISNKMAIYSGCDAAITQALAVGGLGVISVISNLYPCEVSKLCQHFFAGNIEEAIKLQARLIPFIDAAFCETNPAPIKYAMSRIGICKNELRLPLYPVSQASEEKIIAAMDALG